jgi:hypothetical protein
VKSHIGTQWVAFWAALLLGSLVLGAMVARNATLAVAAAGALILLMAGVALPPRLLLPGALLVGLLVPVDNLTYLVGQGRAGVLIAITGSWLLVDVVRSRGQLRLRDGSPSWSVWMWFAAVLLVAAAQRDAGTARVLSVWILAGLTYWWTKARIATTPDVKESIYSVAIFAGVFQSVSGFVQAAVGTPALQSLPGYVPIVRQFGVDIGQRLTGFAGHPLRLGTITMIAALLVVDRLLEGGRGPWERALLGLALLGTTFVCIMSGARGAWLGLAAGVIVLVVASALRGHLARRPAAVLTVGASFLLAWLAFGNLIWTRLFGSTLAADSLRQRLDVFEVSRTALQHPSLLGRGFTGFLDDIYASGLISANVENEYIVTYLGGGLVLGVALLVLAADAVWTAVRSLKTEAGVGAAAMVVALVINIGTYNAFSWTIGPALLLLFLAILQGDLLSADSPRSE